MQLKELLVQVMELEACLKTTTQQMQVDRLNLVMQLSLKIIRNNLRNKIHLEGELNLHLVARQVVVDVDLVEEEHLLVFQTEVEPTVVEECSKDLLIP